MLPVIVGFGGINAAGRSAFHLGYQRLVADALPQATQQDMWLSLATLTGRVRYDAGVYRDAEGAALQPGQVVQRFRGELHNDTLLRRITAEHFDVDAFPCSRLMTWQTETPLRFRVRQREMPVTIPPHWRVTLLDDSNEVEVEIQGEQQVLVADSSRFAVSSAGQLPTGFHPGRQYASRNHPRGLQMTVFGASDAMHSLGIDWSVIRAQVPAQRIAVYCSSSMGQLDDDGTGGMLKSLHTGRRVTSKHCPLGFAEMPGDFINAYMLGSVGATGGVLGACATFLYNLERAVQDIRQGRRDVVLVGAVDAPVTPEVMEGYRAMGALGEDDDLMALDPGATEVDHRRACRPFGYNAGFAMGESAQFVVLMSDRMAMARGLPIQAAVPGVFVNADGWKKSISSPGIGNYLCMGQAVALAESILGAKRLRTRTYVHAHGTGTPQNRVTESHVFNETARAFGIQDWLISSVKCYVGHSLGAAAGDQMMAALGVWAHGVVPGIFTLDRVAQDVHQSHLNLSQQATACGSDGMDAVFLNSKGFGGNNATACVLSPARGLDLMRRQHGQAAIDDYLRRSQAVVEQQQQQRQAAIQHQLPVIYRFGSGVVAGDDLAFQGRELHIPGLEQAVSLMVDNPFGSVE